MGNRYYRNDQLKQWTVLMVPEGSPPRSIKIPEGWAEFDWNGAVPKDRKDEELAFVLSHTARLRCDSRGY